MAAAGMLQGIESPKHLLNVNKTSEAEQAAQALWGDRYQDELYADGDGTPAARGALRNRAGTCLLLCQTGVHPGAFDCLVYQAPDQDMRASVVKRVAMHHDLGPCQV